MTKGRLALALGAAFVLGGGVAWLVQSRKAQPLEGVRYDTLAPATPAAPKSKARLALVLDDWGYQSRLLPRLRAFPGRLTVAVLPGLPHSRACAQAAHEAGHEVILHLPVEPEADIPLVDGTLKVGMDEAEVVALCERHAATVPYMAGLNNHEGSKGSADHALMGMVARWLKRRGGYFLDSLTTPKSVIGAEARAAGLAFARRRIFLDNEDSEAAVSAQAAKALEIALKEGACIAIGHARSNTLAALEALAGRLAAQGVELVAVSDLVEAPR